MQSSDSSNLDEAVNDAVEQRVAQVDQDIQMGPLHGSANVSPGHVEYLLMRWDYLCVRERERESEVDSERVEWK